MMENTQKRVAGETAINDFYQVIKANYIFADKTLMVKEFLESKQNFELLLRPRRFGKSFNMSMLHHFLSPTVAGRKTEGLFDGLKISTIDNGDFLKNHQGKYSVIFIDLKDIKTSSFLNAMEAIKILMTTLYSEHYDLVQSGKLEPYQIEIFNEYLKGDFVKEGLGSEERMAVTRVKMINAIQLLSSFCAKVYPDRKIVVLVDEYDTPLNFAYGKSYLDDLTIFLKEFFGKTFKSNSYIFKSFMTGILRLSKNNMLSELNNLRVYSLFDKNYSAYYGLTLTEVDELFKACGLYDVEKTEAIRRWYNGYQSGDLLVYNPWSIMSCIAEGGELKPYWVMTSNDDLLRATMTHATEEMKEKFYVLLRKEPVVGTVSAFVQFENLTEDEKALWSLLLFAGYLKAVQFERVGLDYRCQLQVPNEEVLCVYQNIFSNWLSVKAGQKLSESLCSNLVAGDVHQFEKDITQFLMVSSSFNDYKQRPENFYHGLMLGLSAQLMETHFLKSNTEAGVGLLDLIYIPKKGTLAIILEFKRTAKEREMSSLCVKALKQIKTRRYAAILQPYGYITDVLMMGMAFAGKKVKCKFEMSKTEKLK